MKNIKLIIEYDGSQYAGWQRQENAMTVQQKIEDALRKLTGEEVSITGSSRTDSGVHARGQVANFFTESSIPPEKYSYALNALLPRDIRIVSSQEVDMAFHARFSTSGKKYKYSIIVSPHGTAIGHQYLHHVYVPLDIDAMREAAGHFVGTHDFAAFMAAGSSAKTTTRTIFDLKLTWDEPYLYISVYGSGFLYNMVRIIAGTLIDVGKGKIRPEEIPDIIASKDRRKAGPTAPPNGLSLEEIYYDQPRGR
jgi:tRNA pseudouridine38-40 synthase